jgi:sugar-specific transcriptional regulator TrmB
VRQGSPTYFRAVDPKNVIEEIRDDFLNCSIDTLNQLKELNYELPKNSPVWYIQSDRVLKTRIREIMDGIREELMIYSTNPEFLKEFEPEIIEVEKIYSVKLIVDKLDKFTSMSFDFRETSKKFTSFMNKIAIDGV